MANVLLTDRGHRPLRLLCLIDSLTGGGAESLLVPYATCLNPARIDLHVCCLKTIADNPFELELRHRGVRVTNLGAHNLRDLPAFRRLLRVIREGGVELIHAHLTYACIWGAVAAGRTGVPCVATLHVMPPTAPAWSREGLRHRLMCRLLNRHARGIMAVSGAVRDAFVQQSGLDRRKVDVVHNGVDWETFAAARALDRGAVRARLGIARDETVILAVAALREDKGLDVLLAAAPFIVAKIPKASFLLVGTGPLAGRLQAQAATRQIDDRCRWLGFRRDLAAIYAASDLFVLPSRADALPTVLLEAMAAGLPIVATRVGGIPEIVGPLRLARLVPPDDPVALGHAVVAILSDAAARESTDRDAYERARMEFSARAWWSRLERVYAQALGWAS